MDGPIDTRDPAYAGRLRRLSSARWKRWLDVQRPYRWNLRRLGLGFTLDLGCGLGRNLAHLGGHGVGVDHNPAAVAECRARGLVAFTPGEFAASGYAGPGRFDALLAAHVLEHMPSAEALALLRRYLPLVRAGGRVALIVPQPAGYRSDPSHVEYLSPGALAGLAARAGLAVERLYSFPFPAWAGRFFVHNETVLVARRG